MKGLNRVLRLGKSAQPVKRGASEVEAAYWAYLTELGWDEGTYEEGGDFSRTDSIVLERIGSADAGTLWQAYIHDGYGYWYAAVFILDDGSSAQPLVAMQKAEGDVALNDELDVSSEVARGLGTDREAWGNALLKALTAPVAKAAPTPRAYAVIKEDAHQRYTLGVAYPHSEVDSHGDWTDETELEKAAWQFMTSGAVVEGGAGTDHADGTDMAGTPVESYIWRGPDWTDEEGTVIAKAGDWMLGVVWGEAAWDRILKDELTGYSIQGLALVDDEAEAPA